MSISDETSRNSPAWSKKDLGENPHVHQDKAKRVEAMFSAIARKYDLNNRLHSMWQDQVWRRKAVDIANLNGDEQVIDVACGTGDLSLAFYNAGVASVLGIDFTEAMLDIAKQKATNKDANIEYLQGDAMQLEVSNASVDVVSIAFGIRNVQKPEVALEEFYRVLKDGGTLIVLEFSTPKNPIVRFLNNIYTKWVMPMTATIISGDTSGAYKYLPKSVETFTDAKDLALQIEACGFNSVVQFPQTFGVCTITRAVKN